MARYPLCNENEIPVGEMRTFTINKEDLLVYHIEDGFYATQSRCTHLNGALEKGKILEGYKIQCRLHRSCFNIRTGEVIQWAHFPPGIQITNIFRKKKNLRSYPVSAEGGRLFVEVEANR